MLGEISRWHLVGCRFVIVEDRIGQFLPIYDTWDVDLKNLPEGTLMKMLCWVCAFNWTFTREGKIRRCSTFIMACTRPMSTTRHLRKAMLLQRAQCSKCVQRWIYSTISSSAIASVYCKIGGRIQKRHTARTPCLLSPQGTRLAPPLPPKICSCGWGLN